MFDCSYLSVCFTYFEPLLHIWGQTKDTRGGNAPSLAISAHSQSQSLNIARAAQRNCQRCPAFRLSNGPRLCLYVLALHSSKAKKKKKKISQPAAGSRIAALRNAETGANADPGHAFTEETRASPHCNCIRRYICTQKRPPPPDHSKKV